MLDWISFLPIGLMDNVTTQVREGFSAQGLQRALPLVVLAALAVVAFYWSTSAWLANEWTSTNNAFEHGFLVVLISAVLLVHAAGKLPADSLRPSWVGVGAVLALSLFWLLARVANVAMVQALVLPVLLLGTLVAILGLRAGRVLAPAVLYLYFALPVWEVLKVPLRDLTIVLVEALLKLGGVPAMIEGALVHIPAGTFRIASGCSGLNFFVVGLALAALYGYTFYTSNTKRVVLLLVGMGIAMFANWMRVALIIGIGDATDMQSGLVSDHQNFGWALFVITLVPFFGFAMWFGRNEPHGKQRSAHNWMGPPLQRRNIVAAVAVFAALAVGPVWAGSVMGGDAADSTVRLSLPTAVDGWQGPVRSGSSWLPRYEGASGQTTARYDSSDGPVWMYQNVYLSQDQGRELVYIHNRVGGDAVVLGNATTDLALESGATFTARIVDVDDGLRSRRIVYWYEVDGRRVATDLRAKLRQAAAVLAGRPQAGLIAVSAMCDLDCSGADERIAGFVAALGADFRLEYTVEGGEL